MSGIELPPRPRILVITLRRLGDALLTTPLIRSLRRAWPDARIEALVFADTVGILEGNPDIDGLIAMPTRPSLAQGLALAAQLLRRYDLAVSTQSGDRPSLFALIAAKASVGSVEDRFSGRLKRLFYRRSTPFVDKLHRVEAILRLADVLGIPRVPEVVPPAAAAVNRLPGRPYAVIHAAPMFRYKQWPVAGWRAVAEILAARALDVVATGGPAEVERRYLDEVWDGQNIDRRDGKLSWPQLAGLLSKAKVYVGPDTSVTHLAAASGCPTVAVYGPTDPRLWGPWPKGGLASPWNASGEIQNRGNVWLVQNPLPCLPCQLEGCERKLESYSACLDELSVDQVLAAVAKAVES